MQCSMFHNVSQVIGPPEDFTLGSTYGSLTAYAFPSAVSSCATGGVVQGVQVTAGPHHHHHHSVDPTSMMTAQSSTVTGIFGHNTMFGNDTIPESEEIFSEYRPSGAGPRAQTMGTLVSPAETGGEPAAFGGETADVPSYLIEDAGLADLPWENGKHDADLPLTKPCVSQMLLDGKPCVHTT
jgi:hypothetical protein